MAEAENNLSSLLQKPVGMSDSDWAIFQQKAAVEAKAFGLKLTPQNSTPAPRREASNG